MKYLWPVRQWYNIHSPEFHECDRAGSCWRFNETVFRRWRLHGHAVVSRVHRLHAAYAATIEARWRAFNPVGRQPVLGLHMRGSDKRSGRRKIYPCVFEAYLVDFFNAFPNGVAYVATESSVYASYAHRAWRGRWGERVYVPSIQTRVASKVANFVAASEKQLQVAHDVFVDMQLLARADYFLHGASAVAEAVIYTNPALHWRSTHLEYEAACAPMNSVCLDAPWRWNYGQHARARVPSGPDSTLRPARP